MSVDQGVSGITEAVDPDSKQGNKNSGDKP